MTFVNNKDSTLNSSRFDEDAKNKIAHCMGVFASTKTEFSKYSGEIAKDITKLCEGWHSACSDLKQVSRGIIANNNLFLQNNEMFVKLD